MVGVAAQTDPWGQVEDLDGTALYATLRLGPKATSDDIRKAYRLLARQHHPDKGGDPGQFGALQHAYEVLSDPHRRQVYDTWAKELQFRYVRPTSQAQGGEDILLDEFEALGLRCDPATQLVVTCEVCRRPATKSCWTCGMAICEFCTLKRHWRDGWALHWPLVNSDHMRERLARRELERKRIEDSKRLALEDPNHRTERELQDIRAFKAAAYELLRQEDRLRRYDLRLARFYMWAQTACTVHLACRVPSGYEDKELVMECSGGVLLVQSEDSPPLIQRELAYALDASLAMETMRTEDNRVCTISLPKGEPGQRWERLFAGDSDRARCLEPPYSLFEGEDEVVMQVELPFWIDPGDVRVAVEEKQLQVEVRNTLLLGRQYWWSEEEEARRPGEYAVVQPEASTWVLEEDVSAAGERCKVLTLTLVRPDPTEEETTWKKGRRQDNTTASRPGSMQLKGFRFFADDEDAYELEEVLQSLCFAEAGAAYVPPKPWARGEEARWASDSLALPPNARALLHRLQAAAPNAASKNPAPRAPSFV